MNLLEETTWQGRIYSGGWMPGSGGEYDATEPATGAIWLPWALPPPPMWAGSALPSREPRSRSPDG